MIFGFSTELVVSEVPKVIGLGISHDQRKEGNSPLNCVLSPAFLVFTVIFDSIMRIFHSDKAKVAKGCSVFTQILSVVT